MGKAIKIANADFSAFGLGTVTFVRKVPLVSLSVVCADALAENTQIGVAYNPVDTTQRSVEFTIVSGGTYATITTDGMLTILNTANNSPVTIRVASLDNPSIYAEKTIAVSYTPTGDEPINFADSAVKQILLNNGVGGVTIPGEITVNEAKAVTSIGAWFKGNTTIVSFNEFKYFTGISSFSRNVGTFNGCTALVSIELPSTITATPEDSNGTQSTFGGCTSLTTVRSSLTYVGNHTFNGCSALESYDLSEATYVGASAFYGTPLKSINLTKAVTIGAAAFGGSTHNDLESITWGNDLTTINYTAFLGTYKLGDLVLPGSITSIGYNNFTSGSNSYRNTIAKSFKISEGTGQLTLLNGLFGRYDALEVVDLPSNLYSINGRNWFGNRATGAPSVSLIIRATTVPTLSEAFTVSPGAIYVPDSAVNDYKADSAWSAYASIIQPLSNYVE